MDFKVLQNQLNAFAAARNWEPFHTPKNLSMALMVEAAELLELFQWKTPEESRSAKLDAALQMRIGEELADVLLYLVQLAGQTGIDLEHAVADKLIKNSKKHPIPFAQAASSHEKQNPAQTYVLVDWENVQPKEADIRRLVPDVTDVWIFHGPNQKRVGDNQQSFGEALTLVPISRPGKNALDFHLSYYVGYISSRHPSARFVVISNDQGYGPMLEHAAELGFAASQVGFATAVSAKKVVAKKAPAKKVPAKKVASARTSAQPDQKAVASKTTKTPAAQKTVKSVARKATAKAPAAVQPTKTSPPTKKAASTKAKAKKASPLTPAAAVPDEEKAYAHVLASLRKSKNKPAREARLYGAVKSLLGMGKDDDASVSRVVQRLVNEGHLVIDANGAVTKTP